MRCTSPWSPRSNSRIKTASLRTSLASAGFRAALDAGELHIIDSFLVPGIASCSSATILVSQTILGDEKCMQLAARISNLQLGRRKQKKWWNSANGEKKNGWCAWKGGWGRWEGGSFLKKQRNDERGGKTKGDVLLQPWALLTTKTCRCESSRIYMRAGRVDAGSGVGGGPPAAQIGGSAADGGRREGEARSSSPRLNGLSSCVPAKCVFWGAMHEEEGGVMERERVGGRERERGREGGCFWAGWSS